jgi:hypothetical protein
VSVEIIDLHLHGRGEVIIREAERAGLKLPLACALVEQESNGRNIFGGDHGPENTWTPPFYRIPVTWERVQMLLQHIDEGGESNGVGLSQLTAPELIRSAEALGGAHLPRYQLRVGFKLLRSHIDALGLRHGIGAYNGGRGNPILSYADEVLAKRDEWRKRLA